MAPLLYINKTDADDSLAQTVCERGRIVGVALPSGVRDFGDYLFYKCTNLRSVSLPDSLECIPRGTFFECRSLSGIVFPPGLIEIGSYAFFSCAFQSVEIPESVVKIGTMAFSDCSLLSDIRLHNGLTDMGDKVFDNTKWSYENRGKGAIYFGELFICTAILNTILDYRGI